MGDFPLSSSAARMVIGSQTSHAMTGQWNLVTGNLFSSAAVWPAANRAIYVPVMVEVPGTAYKMSFNVGTQSGNYDIGIYDRWGTRLVSKGSTAVPVAGNAIVDITDTVLSPAIYFLGLCIDNITAQVVRSTSHNTQGLQVCGVREQAVGAVTLPATATFANPSAAFVPLVMMHMVANV